MVIAVTAAAAQEPGPRPVVVISEIRAAMKLVGPATSPAAVIEHLMSRDVNADGRIARDELPERMQELVARGDKNADAALDSHEIRALVNAAASERIRRAFRPPTSEGLPGVISDLKLPPARYERALVIVSAHKPPDIEDPASSALFGEMKALLDDEEYQNFVAATTRLSRTDFRLRAVVR